MKWCISLGSFKLLNIYSRTALTMKRWNSPSTQEGNLYSSVTGITATRTKCPAYLRDRTVVIDYKCIQRRRRRRGRESLSNFSHHFLHLYCPSLLSHQEAGASFNQVGPHLFLYSGREPYEPDQGGGQIQIIESALYSCCLLHVFDSSETCCNLSKMMGKGTQS